MMERVAHEKAAAGTRRNVSRTRYALAGGALSVGRGNRLKERTLRHKLRSVLHFWGNVAFSFQGLTGGADAR